MNPKPTNIQCLATYQAKRCEQVREVLFRCTEYVTGRQTTEDNYPRQLRRFLLESCTDPEMQDELYELFGYMRKLEYSRKYPEVPEDIIFQRFESLLVSVLNQSKDLFNLLKTPANATIEARSKLVQGLFDEGIWHTMELLEEEFRAEE